MIVEASFRGDVFFWLAVSAAVLGSLLVVRYFRRRGPHEESRPPDRRAGTETGGEQHAATADEARAASSWASRLADISTSLDVDEVLPRALAMAGEIPGAEAAMIVLRPVAGGRDPLVASVGMSAGEMAGRLSELPEGVRTTIVSYRYRRMRARPEGLCGGFVVPLVAEERQIGSLSVFWRIEDRQPEERDIAMLEELAQRTAAATRNAERFAQGRELVSRDPVTRLGNRRFLEDALAREVPRAQRYGHPLTVLMAGIDGLGPVHETACRRVASRRAGRRDPGNGPRIRHRVLPRQRRVRGDHARVGSRRGQCAGRSSSQGRPLARARGRQSRSHRGRCAAQSGRDTAAAARARRRGAGSRSRERKGPDSRVGPRDRDRRTRRVGSTETRVLLQRPDGELTTCRRRSAPAKPPISSELIILRRGYLRIGMSTLDSLLSRHSTIARRGRRERKLVRFLVLVRHRGARRGHGRGPRRGRVVRVVEVDRLGRRHRARGPRGVRVLPALRA